MTVEGIAGKTEYVRRGEVSGVPIDYISVPKNLSKYHREDSLINWAERWFAEQRVDVLHLFLFSDLLGLIPAARNLEVPIFLTALEFSYFCRRFDLMRFGSELCTPGARGGECEECVLEEFSNNQRNLASVARRMPVSMEDNLRKLPIKLFDQDRFPALGERTITKQIEEQRASFASDIAGVIAPSTIMKQFYLANDVPATKIHFVPYGTDVKPIQYSTNGNGHKALRVGFIGRLHPSKGVNVLCDAMSQLPGNLPIQLKIFGPSNSIDPTYFEKIESVVKNDQRIQLNGPLDRDGVMRAYRELDVLVAPSMWYENSPITMSEALACGCPIICSDTAGMTDTGRRWREWINLSDGR